MEAQQVFVAAEVGKMSPNEKVGKETGRKEKFTVHFHYWNHFMKKKIQFWSQSVPSNLTKPWYTAKGPHRIQTSNKI